MFDWTAHLQETAAHLLRLNSMRGWKDYAKERRDELLAHPWYGESLRAELNRLQAKPGSSES